MKATTPFICSAKHLASGEKMELAPLSVKTEKSLSFTCEINELSEGKIRIGHGKEITAASWIEISAEEVAAFSYYAYSEIPLRPLFPAPLRHGLSIGGTLSVTIEIDAFYGRSRLKIEAGSEKFETALMGWDGCNGEIFAETENAALDNCVLRWESRGLLREIWILGDSFVGLTSKNRWPYYLLHGGYTGVLISGYPGMKSAPAIEQFRLLSQAGSPRIVLWALGMNNGDKDGRIDKEYLAATEEFLSICQSKGITPILATIPNTPIVDNRYKNAWVRSLPHRYIDFASAVGSDITENWFEGMLCNDKVHPDEKGAVALYEKLLSDLPEIRTTQGGRDMKDAKLLFKNTIEKKGGITVKLLGDSITHGVGGTGWQMNGDAIVEDFKRSPDSFCWAKLFKDYMKEKYDAEVINNACTGTTIQFIIQYFNTLVSESDDLVICTIGTNNRHRAKELGDPPSREEWGECFYNSVLELNARFEAKGIPVIFVANLPAAQNNELDGETYYRILHMDDINKIYKKASEKAGFAMISLYDLVSNYLKEKGILVDAILTDGLHPSDEGYKIMFALLCEALKA